jgi:hypothetical protein
VKPRIFEPQPAKLALLSRLRNIAALHRTSCEIHTTLSI